MSFLLRRSSSNHTSPTHNNSSSHFHSSSHLHNTTPTSLDNLSEKSRTRTNRYSNASESKTADPSISTTSMGDDDEKDHGPRSRWQCMSSIRLTVLLVLCFQNSLFTLTRRYSQGILQESYSKYECLLVGEVLKMAFSAYMIKGMLDPHTTLMQRLRYLLQTSKKMFVLALVYGVMNILSFVALRNIGAGMFTIFAQLKILTTASFSSLMLNRTYSWTKWRALLTLMCGVCLFSHPIWQSTNSTTAEEDEDEDDTAARALVGITAVTAEVLLSGFASIYFEKAIKTDPLKLSIWERNFQLALGSFPVYVAFILRDYQLNNEGAHGASGVGIGGGWTPMAWVVALLGAVGGLLVALSIKYGDSILKTLATTGAIVLSSILDHFLLGGPLTPIMALAGVQVIVAICDYAFDQTTTIAVETKLAEASTTPAVTESPRDEEVALIRAREATTGQ